MSAVAKNVVKEDALALAEYFAAKPWPNIGAPAASEGGRRHRQVAIKSVVCTSCHLEQFQGDSSVPRLAGQQRDYLLKTMTDFRNRTRANNPGMSDLMNTVTPEQLRRSRLWRSVCTAWALSRHRRSTIAGHWSRA